SRSYDSVAPTVTMSSAAPDPTNTSPIPVTVQFSEAVTGFLATDITPTNATVGGFVTVDGDTYTFNLTPSGEGLVAADIAAGVAADTAGNGNTAAAQFSRTFDDGTPDTTIDSQPANPSNSANAVFTFSGTDNLTPPASLTFQCSLDGAAFGACPVNYTGLADVSHTFQVRAVDEAGNSDPTPASYTWVVDTIPPNTIITGIPSNPTSSTTAIFAFTGNDGGGTGVTSYACNLDGAGFAPCTSLWTYNGLGDGSHTFRVQATDAASNTDATPASITWAVDTAAPTVTNVSSTHADGSYTTPEVILITVTFSEPVNVTGTPQLTLETGTTDRVVNYSSGSGTATLTFNYTVQAGDTSPDLDYVATTSLALNGGAIRDAVNHDAALTLASPGTAGSLGANKAIAIYTPLGITSPNNVTFVAGNLSSFTITTTGAPTPTISYTGTIPLGITFADNGDGTATLSGTPAIASVGTYNLTFTASNGVAPNATQGFTLTIDGPPGVARINSSADTGDGQIDENEYTNVAITQLLVVFNKAMNADTPADLDDALNVENYSLIQDGSTVITINSITYAAQTAALGVNGGVPLPNGRYTLTVEGNIEDTLGVPIGADFVRIFYVDSGAPYPTSILTVQGDRAVTNGATINVRFSSIDVTFNEDLYDPAGNVDPDDVTNVENYLLVTPGPNGVFDTSNCLLGLGGDDLAVPIGPLSYTNHGGAGPFVATAQLNNGIALPNGRYLLFLCGMTSIVDVAGNPLNNGADERVAFTVLIAAGQNPQTGFAPGVVTLLPEQPADKAYTDLGSLWIEIPSLSMKTGITGVPLNPDGWDVTWLHWQVGWLEGTAYPTWEGNTVLTAHGYTADGEAGPFARLKELSYGQTVVIHLGGMKYTYAVRTNLLISPQNTYWLTRHEELDWITLITCQQYDANTKSYRYRRVVRAVLVSVEQE
ncbi:MAG: sortase, partial [Anaerolineales bacterium]